MNLPNNAISAEDAAKIAGITAIHMRNLIRVGKINAVKIRKCWYVDLDSLNDYINKNGSGKSTEVVINGEHAIGFTDFCRERGIKKTNDLLVNTAFLNGKHYITDSEVQRYDRRFEEYYGRKIISTESVMKQLCCDMEQLEAWIADKYLEIVTIEDKSFVFADTLKRFEDQLEAGLDFLGIPLHTNSAK